MASAKGTLTAIKINGTPYQTCSVHKGLLHPDATECRQCAWRPICDVCGGEVPTIAAQAAMAGAGYPTGEHTACKKELGSFWIKPNEKPDMTKCNDCGHDLRLHVTGCRDCVTCLRRARGAVCTHTDAERGPEYQTECVVCDEEDAGIASERKQPCENGNNGDPCGMPDCDLCGGKFDVEPPDGMLLAKDEKYA